MRRRLISSQPRLAVSPKELQKTGLTFFTVTGWRVVVMVTMLGPIPYRIDTSITPLTHWSRRLTWTIRQLIFVHNTLSFEMFHIIKPVDFLFHATPFSPEFLTVKPFRIVPVPHVSCRLSFITVESTFPVKVPVLQGFVPSIHGGRFGALGGCVCKPLGPDMPAVLGHIDYLGVKR